MIQRPEGWWEKGGRWRDGEEEEPEKEAEKEWPET